MDQENQSTDTPDPWDRALLGSAAASMYRSAPASKQATATPTAPVPPQPRSNDVTSLFRSKAGIPHDIKPVPPPPTPVAAPVASIAPPTPVVAIPEVKLPPVVVPPPPPKVTKPTVEVSILASVPRKAVPALVPAHPMKAVALHLVIFLLGIPLFVGGFYLADYLKNSMQQPTVAAVQQGVDAPEK